MSVTASLPEVRRRNPALRILYYAICLLLAALIVAVWWLYWIAHSAVPQMDGSIAVPGIYSEVRVARDDHGVPTIEAATLEDLFFAQGYVTAQDRLWQMDITRQKDSRPADQSHQTGYHQIVMELVLYTRRDCELCHEMEAVIGEVLP